MIRLQTKMMHHIAGPSSKRIIMLSTNSMHLYGRYFCWNRIVIPEVVPHHPGLPQMNPSMCSCRCVSMLRGSMTNWTLARLLTNRWNAPGAAGMGERRGGVAECCPVMDASTGIYWKAQCSRYKIRRHEKQNQWQ